MDGASYGKRMKASHEANRDPLSMKRKHWPPCHPEAASSVRAIHRARLRPGYCHPVDGAIPTTQRPRYRDKASGTPSWAPRINPKGKGRHPIAKLDP